MNTKKIAFLIILIVLTTLYANTALADTLNYEDYELPSYPPGTPLGTCRYVDGNDEIYLMYGSLNDCPSQVYIEYNDQTFNRIGGINFDECGALYAAFDQTQMCSSRSASSATGTTSPCSYKISETDNIVTREGIDFTSDVCRCGNDFYSINDPGYCDDGVYLLDEGSTASSASNPDRADYINSDSYPGSLYGACVFHYVYPPIGVLHVFGETTNEYNCDTYDISTLDFYDLPGHIENRGWYPGTMGEGWPDPLRFFDSDASAMAAVLPPFCPHDISKLGGVAEYCHCGGETLSVSDGGRCDYADPVLCTDLDSCGDWQIGGYINHREEHFDYTGLISRNSFNFFPSTLRPGHSGNTVPARQMGRHDDSYFYSIYSTWVFLDEDKVVEFRGEVNEGLTMTVFRAEPSGRGGWNIEEINRVTRSRQRNANQADDLRISLTESPSRVLERGWYLINIVYWDRGGEDYLVLEPHVDGSRMRVNDAFKVVNSYGPLGLDPGLFDEEEDAEWACTSDPYLNGDWHSGWETDEYNIRCCGIDPENFGRQAPDELVCTTSGWSRIEKCVDDDGNPIENTHYLPGIEGEDRDVACCGNNPGSASGGGDLGRISPDGQFVCLDDAGGHPGTGFIWRDAVDQSNSFFVRQAEDTHFISNSAEWLYCDASGGNLYTDRNVDRYKSFDDVDLGIDTCDGVLEHILPDEFRTGGGSDVYRCSDEYYRLDCRRQANQEGLKAYCYEEEQHNNDFINVCTGLCEVNDSGNWRSMVEGDFASIVERGNGGPGGNDFVDSGCTEGRFSHRCFDDFDPDDNGEVNGDDNGDTTTQFISRIISSLREKSDSFICYDYNNNNYFRECCSIFNPAHECSNYENRLRYYGQKSISALDGQPMHSLLVFDNMDGIGYYRSDNRDSNQPTEFSAARFNNMKDWGSTYNYLHFQITYNRDALGDIVFRDGDGVTVSLDLNDYINIPGDVEVWSSVTIPLSDITSVDPDFNLNDVNRFEVRVTEGPTSLIFDNFYLSGSVGRGVDDSVPGETFYCSGHFGNWIDNLDGPYGDEGFNNADDDGIPEYRYACNVQPAFGWTGTKCCGDDTIRGEIGEFFIDTEGVCWQGASVFNDSTIASSMSLDDYASRNLTERSLLFYDENVYSCNLEPSEYYDISFSYDGFSAAQGNFGDEVIMEGPFSVRGSWMCEEGQGWVRLEDVNRLRLLATMLNQVAVEDSDDAYTLFCGDSVNASNYLWTAEVAEDILGNLCVLRTGPNNVPVDNPEHLVLGLEVVNTTVDINDYIENVLYKFLPFAEEEFDPETSSIDCSDAEENPATNRFFSHCGSENGLHVYYNKPFNLLIVSNPRLTGDYTYNSNTFLGFFADSWYQLSNWWNNIFRSPEEYSSPFENIPVDVRDLYVAVQGDKSIVGTLSPQATGNLFTGEVSYHRMNTDVSLLRDIMSSSNPDIAVDYLADGIVQGLHFSSVTKDDWKKISSDLRLDDSYPEEDFGFVCPPPFREVGTGDDRVCEPPQCRVDDDCTGGSEQVCRDYGFGPATLRQYEYSCDVDEGRCRRTLVSVNTCTELGFNMCSRDRTECVDCNRNSDCSSGQECADGICVPYRDEDDDEVSVSAHFNIRPSNPHTYSYITFESLSDEELTHSWRITRDSDGGEIESRGNIRSFPLRINEPGDYTAELTVSYEEEEDTRPSSFSVSVCEETTCEDLGMIPCRYLEPPYPDYEPNGETPEPRQYCVEVSLRCIEPNGEPESIWCEDTSSNGGGSDWINGDDRVFQPE